MTKQKAPIVVTIGATDFKFTPSVMDYNNYLNEMMPSNKAVPATDYLMRTVDPEQKAELQKLLAEYPIAQDVFGTVTEAAKGGLTITLKK